jgi:hypothetical protein
MTGMRRGIMLILRSIAPTVFGLGLLAEPHLCRAANNCPWISEATVSGLLGGNAVGQVTSADADRTTVCEFTEQSTGFMRTLRVTIEVSEDAHIRLVALARSCGIDTALLKAIGNEALMCSANDPRFGHVERVVGRVRNQLFTIFISTALNSDPILTRDALRTRIYTAAEQVAGNLF